MDGETQTTLREQKDKIDSLEKQIKMLTLKVDRMKDGDELLKKANASFENKEEIIKSIKEQNKKEIVEIFLHNYKIIDGRIACITKDLIKQTKESLESLDKNLFRYIEKQQSFNTALLMVLEENKIDVSSVYPTAKKMALSKEIIIRRRYKK